MITEKHLLTIPCPHCGQGNSWASDSERADNTGYHIPKTSGGVAICSGCGKNFGFEIELHVLKRARILSADAS
jgi:transcription elongation factor Elf1